MPVLNRLGAIATDRMPRLPRSRAIVEHHARDAGLGGRVRDLADLTLERGDRRGVDDDAALVVLGLVLRHVPRLEPVEVERRDQVELDDPPEVVERVRAVLAERAHRDAAARGVHRDVQPAERVDRVGQRELDALVVDDVDRVERAAQLRRDLGAGRRRQVEDRDRRALLAQQLGRRRPCPTAPPTTTMRLRSRRSPSSVQLLINLGLQQVWHRARQ